MKICVRRWLRRPQIAIGFDSSYNWPERPKSDNPEHSGQHLTRAYVLAAGRATNYEQLQNKLQVSRMLSSGNLARTFELLQSGITQLNELISAAATLNGFEVEMFVLNEMPLPGNSQLGAMVIQYGQDLALLAKSDFHDAVAAAEQFQYPEASLFARLSIVGAALDLTISLSLDSNSLCHGDLCNRRLLTEGYE